MGTQSLAVEACIRTRLEPDESVGSSLGSAVCYELGAGYKSVGSSFLGMAVLLVFWGLKLAAMLFDFSCWCFRIAGNKESLSSANVVLINLPDGSLQPFDSRVISLRRGVGPLLGWQSYRFLWQQV